MAIDTPARIAIVGAGPIGLEAALYARYLGYDVDLFERGDVAEHVRHWGHVRMFTPFAENRTPLAIAALGAQDPQWQPPADDALLTGREYAERYLVPLAKSDLLIDSLHAHAEVLSIGREGWLRTEGLTSEDRADSNFRLLVRERDDGGHWPEKEYTAEAVIDTSGTYGRGNWLGADGLPAAGERTNRAHIEYGLPDVLGNERSRYAGRNILLVGDGDSAVSTLVALAELAAQTSDTWITWLTRTPPEGSFGNKNYDQTASARLHSRARQLAEGDANHVTRLPGRSVCNVAWHADLDRFSVRLFGEEHEQQFDRIVANVGYRGEYSWLEELPLERAATTDAVKTTGDWGVITTEPDFYVLGAKSRGRDSQFRIAQGHEQIRKVFAIIGDREGLNLYKTYP
jgi:thioredoxin reductase